MVGRPGSRREAHHGATAGGFRNAGANLATQAADLHPVETGGGHFGERRLTQRTGGHKATGRRPDVSSSYILKLYVTGKTPRTERAVANLRRICTEDLRGKYELQIIDVLENPQLAEDEKILATPTLIKRLPPPLRRVIGDLSDKEKVLLGLDVWPDTPYGSDEPDEPAAGEEKSP
jgi:circadian clock protein KaiB